MRDKYRIRRGMTDLRVALLTVSERYCAAAGISKPRLATLIANDGKFFDRVESGGGFTVRTFERAMRWLSDHWPAEAIWPEEISRPAPAAPSEAA